MALSVGRDAFTDADLARAAEELGGGVSIPLAPEGRPVLEQVTAWDDPPTQAGRREEGKPPEDERNIAERLRQGGIDEADHFIRVAAAEDETASGL